METVLLQVLLTTTLALAFLLIPCTAAAKKGGFSLELIHSAHSQEYSPPLAAGNRWSSFRRLHDGEVHLRLRPIPLTDIHNGYYAVKLKIGTPGVEAQLLFDTGSGLIWIQAEPCNTCFEHDGPNYLPAQSTTFRGRLDDRRLKIFCTRPRFQESSDGNCAYKMKYAGGRSGPLYTRGTLATENFKFASNNHEEILTDMVFGTSYNSSEDMFNDTPQLVGILGMDMSPHSFAAQIAKSTGDGRFAYCLPSKPGVTSHLRFGSDIDMGVTHKGIPLSDVGSSSGRYYVKLVDISIDGHRLNLPKGTFSPERTGGCLMDTGSPITSMIGPAYRAIKEELVRYFKRHGLQKASGHQGLDLCYRMPPEDEFKQFPSIDLLFRGGNAMGIGNDIAFQKFKHGNKSKFCLLMESTERTTVIGSPAQHNKQFVYDVLNR